MTIFRKDVFGLVEVKREKEGVGKTKQKVVEEDRLKFKRSSSTTLCLVFPKRQSFRPSAVHSTYLA